MRIRLKLEHLRQPLLEAGFTTGGTDGDVSVLTADEIEPEPIEAGVRFVVGGGRALICGGEGKLLTGLQLQHRGGATVAGVSTAAYPGLPDLGDVELPVVTGPGFALYRVAEACVALGAPRGDGVVAYVGTANPPANLLEALLHWLSGVRFDSR